MQKLYQWDRWFSIEDGFVLRRYVDYYCSHSSMSQQVRNEASKRGIGVSIMEQDDSLVVILKPREESAACPR